MHFRAAVCYRGEERSGTLILLIIAVYMIATGRGNIVLWCIFGFLGLVVLSFAIENWQKRKKKTPKWTGSVYPPVRRYNGTYDNEEDEEEEEDPLDDLLGAKIIKHPHYYDDADYECSKCGARFDEPHDRCPECDSRFVEKKVDYEEYEDEEDDEYDMDEEDGW